MASIARRFFQSPLRVMLIVQALLSLAMLALLVVALAIQKGGSSQPLGPLNDLGAAVQSGVAGGGGLTLMWVTLAFMGLLLAASLVFGLIYGRWGLPAYLQGRAVYFVPPLAAIYFVIGRLVLAAIDRETLAGGWTETLPLLKTSAGLTLILLYAALSTAAVGLGWAVALAITHWKRSRGQWETIGYVGQA
jgi:hypothetical protein